MLTETPVLEDLESRESGAKGTEAKARVQSAVRTVSILLAVAESSDGLVAKDIMNKLSLSRQVTYHLLHTMQSTGIVRRNERNRYVLGLAAAMIADGFQRQLAPPEHLGPRVRAVASATGESAYAGGWVDGEIVALAAVRGDTPVGAAQLPLGYSSSAHARAAGKLLLALASPAVRDSYLETHPLEARTRKTITDHTELLREFDRIRARGYSIDDGEFNEGLRCLAVPVENLGGRFVLGISVPSERFESNFDNYLGVLQRLARVNG